MVSWIVVGIVILLFYILFSVLRIRHSFIAVTIIVILLFFAAGFIVVFQGKSVDFTSTKGLSNAAGLYFNWLGGVFDNMKTVTTNAVKLNWKGNSTQEDLKKK